MSIRNGDDEEIVSLPGLWSLLIKVALLMFPVIFSVILTICGYLIMKSFEHDSRIAVLEYAGRNRGEHSGQTTSVNVGQTPTEDEAAKFRDYYTTEEVAAKLGKSARTVTSLCDSGEIPAVKEGREWHIPKDFELCGDQRLTTADSGN